MAEMTPERLRRIREGTGLQQGQFARRIGYEDTNAYARYERGNRPIPFLLAMLARYIEKHGIMK